ncbi:MAG: hypothetical protein RL701_2832 [Pseudomonadota bacterium]|jgi:serine/threonine protein kinase
MSELHPSAVLLPVGTRVGKYTIQSALGAGGMATVYLVRHDVLDKPRALKVLNPALLANAQLRDRFLAEAQIQATLRHPNVVEVNDIFSDPSVAAIVMEYIEGPTLQDYLMERGALPWLEVIGLISDVIAGVDCAHQANIVHRDLKPSNVLLAKQRDGTLIAKVCDFGIAKHNQEGKSQTKTGAHMGTVGYMSPEQIRDAARVDRRADIWAIGAIMHEMLTGKRAFDGNSDFDIMVSITQGTRPDMRQTHSGIPDDMHDIVSRALSVDSAKRFPDGGSMLAALQQLRQRAAILPQQPAVPQPQRIAFEHTQPLAAAAIPQPAAAKPFAPPKHEEPMRPVAQPNRPPFQQGQPLQTSWWNQYLPSIVLAGAALCVLAALIIMFRILFADPVTSQAPGKSVRRADAGVGQVKTQTGVPSANAQDGRWPTGAGADSDTKPLTAEEHACLGKDKNAWFSQCRSECGARPGCMLENVACRCAR